MESPTKETFLVVYSSRLFPSHWGVLVPSSRGTDAGTLINAIGDPSAGFEHDFKRDYGGEDTRRVAKTLLLGKVAFEHAKDRKEVGQSTDNVPNNTLEDVALSVPPPYKSLRSSKNSVGVKVEMKNCQSWLREYVIALVEKNVFEASALDVVDSAPKIASMDAAR